MKLEFRSHLILTVALMSVWLSGCNNNFTVEDIPTPFKITNLKGGNSELFVTWPIVANATEYIIFYRPVGSDTWNTQTARRPPALITGLSNGRDYEVRVEANNNKGTSISDVRVGRPTANSIAYMEQTSGNVTEKVTQVSTDFGDVPMGTNERARVSGSLAPPTTALELQASNPDPTFDPELSHTGNYRVFMNFSGIYKSEEYRALFRN